MPDETPVISLEFHPRMQEDGTLAPSPESTESAPEAESSVPPETPPAAPEEPAAPPPSAETVDDGFYKVSKSNPYDDIRRHATADPEFNRKVREWAGRQNRREYESELARLKAERDSLATEVTRRDILAMKPEDIEQRYRSDPEFARTYTDLMHPDPDAVPDVELQTEAAYYEDTRDNLLDEAKDVGMADWRIQQYKDAFGWCPVHKTGDHGFYDHDASGQFFEERFKDPAMARKASFDFFQKTLNTNILQLREVSLRRTPASAPVQVEPQAPVAQAAPETPLASDQSTVGQANPNLQKTPDTSLRGGVGGGANVRYTDEDLRAMGVDKRIETVAAHGGRVKMIEDGILYVPGLSEEVHGQAVAPR